MRNLALIFLLIVFSTSVVFAQRADSASKLAAKARNIEGSVISSSGNIVQSIFSAPNFSILAQAIKSARLTDTLSTINPITVFAPDNKAFGKLAPGVLDTLMLPTHIADLKNLILNHIVSGRTTSRDINRQIKAGNSQVNLTTLARGTLTAKINENRNIVLTNPTGAQSVISSFDIQQNNGVLHIITAVLMPGGKMTN